MADKKENHDDNREKDPIEPKDKGAEGGDAGRTYTQAEVDKIRNQAAYAARAQAKKDNIEVSDLQEEIAELQKFKEEASKDLEDYRVLKAEKEDRELRKKVAEEVGVDYEVVSMLAGNNEEELTKNAKKHKEKFGTPQVPYGKNSHGNPGKEKSLSEETESFVDQLFKHSKAE